MFNDAELEEIKTHLGEYAASVLAPSKGGGYICPLCGSGAKTNFTGAFHVKGTRWTCFSCGAAGDIFDLVGAIENLPGNSQRIRRAKELLGRSYSDAAMRANPEEKVKWEALRQSRQAPEPEQKAKTDYLPFFLQAMTHINDTEYHRGLTTDTLHRYKVGYVAEWRHPKAPPSAPTSPRLIVPIDDFSYLARDVRELKDIPDPQRAYIKQRTEGAGIFNKSALREATSPIWITEGEIDALSIIDVEGAAIALGGVTKVQQLLQLLDRVKPCQPLVIALDNDGAGKAWTEKLEMGLSERGIAFARLPPDALGDAKDANEFLMRDWKGLGRVVDHIKANIGTLIAETKAAMEQKNVKGEASVESRKERKSFILTDEDFEDRPRRKGDYTITFDEKFKKEFDAELEAERARLEAPPEQTEQTTTAPSPSAPPSTPTPPPVEVPSLYSQLPINGEAAKYYKDNSVGGFIEKFKEEIYKSEEKRAVSTGFPSLDKVLGEGLWEGLYIIGAGSSIGKTTLTLQIGDQIAAAGGDVLIFSLEMGKHELVAKSVSRHTCIRDLQRVGYLRDGKTEAKTMRGILDGRRYKFYSQSECELIDNAIQDYRKYADRRVFIIEGGDGTAIRDIKGMVEKHISYTGHKPVVIVDYLQILAPNDKRATDKQNTDYAVKALRQIARDQRIPVIAVSSLNRASYTGAKQSVGMASFKESGSIEYSADTLIGMQLFGAESFDDEKAMKAKKESPRKVELVILKNRSGVTGDRLSFEYYPAYNYFRECEPWGES